jgi:hypothetical protein
MDKVRLRQDTLLVLVDMAVPMRLRARVHQLGQVHMVVDPVGWLVKWKLVDGVRLS